MAFRGSRRVCLAPSSCRGASQSACDGQGCSPGSARLGALQIPTCPSVQITPHTPARLPLLSSLPGINKAAGLAPASEGVTLWPSRSCDPLRTAVPSGQDSTACQGSPLFTAVAVNGSWPEVQCRGSCWPLPGGRARVQGRDWPAVSWRRGGNSGGAAPGPQRRLWGLRKLTTSGRETTVGIPSDSSLQAGADTRPDHPAPACCQPGAWLVCAHRGAARGLAVVGQLPAWFRVTARGHRCVSHMVPQLSSGSWVPAPALQSAGSVTSGKSPPSLGSVFPAWALAFCGSAATSH